MLPPRDTSMVSMYFFMLLSIFIIITLNSLSNKSLASISSSSFSGEFSCSFICGLFLCLLILAASLHLFISIRQLCKDCGIGLFHMLLVTGPGQPVLSYQQSTARGSSAGPLCAERTRLCTITGFYHHQALGRVS